MILWVLDALAQSEEVGATVLSGPPSAQLEQNRQLREGIANAQWGWQEPGAAPSTSAYAALRSLDESTPVLVTTADHALLRNVIVDHFCAEARQTGCDLVVAFVTYAQVTSAFPGMRRTAIRFRDGAFCGCNLYAFLTPEARKAADFWRQVEQKRKHPWRMIKMLGWWPLLAYLTRRLTLDAALEMLSKRLGLRICQVLLPFPEAAVDVDKPTDLDYVESILRTDRTRYDDRRE
jgi:GTP:adenosylcobinamide-phosphate guanylyltransferase